MKNAIAYVLVALVRFYQRAISPCCGVDAGLPRRVRNT